MYVRFWTVKTSWVMAFKAASTFTRWRPDGRFDKQPFNTPDDPQKGGKHKMGGIHEEDSALASLSFR